MLHVTRVCDVCGTNRGLRGRGRRAPRLPGELCLEDPAGGQLTICRTALSSGVHGAQDDGAPAPPTQRTPPGAPGAAAGGKAVRPTAALRARGRGDGRLPWEGPGQARDTPARRLRLVPRRVAEPSAPARLAGLMPRPPSRASAAGRGADGTARPRGRHPHPRPQCQRRRVWQRSRPGCPAPHGTPDSDRLTAARRACAWPRSPPRCRVALWRDWYGRRVPARPADSPRPARRGARHGS